MKTILKIDEIFKMSFGYTYFVGTLIGKKDFFEKGEWLLKENGHSIKKVVIVSEQMPPANKIDKRILVSNQSFDKSTVNLDKSLILERIDKDKSEKETYPYKTYKGKNYTEEEWKLFEEKQYQEYLRKKGKL
ncbi:hypothetical protein ETU08_06235 [Apibacter muscae]|uniref:hypothetical protein n=1 Tax=Apibacter muscae TaxID=2509004 RepID=UPI0011ADAD04|nr:hypothetical protein [Apibacter muscae]TWP30152.1 hypothetical protein ETU08_06235 [Apibacter muscae]